MRVSQGVGGKEMMIPHRGGSNSISPSLRPRDDDRIHTVVSLSSSGDQNFLGQIK